MEPKIYNRIIFSSTESAKRWLASEFKNPNTIYEGTFYKVSLCDGEVEITFIGRPHQGYVPFDLKSIYRS